MPGRSLTTWTLPPTWPPAWARPATSLTRSWPRSCSWPPGCSGRCCWRASRAPARPPSPRRSPQSLDLPLIRLQCYEGIDASQALYDWDFPRQILHLRALEAAGDVDSDEAEKSLYDERFLLSRPVLAALRQAPAVLLVDEVDRADDEFEAFLLEVLSTWQVTIPEFGTVTAPEPPLVVLTSNRTRELHDALKRRCLYHWIDHPGLEREVEIVRSRAPEVSETLARQVVGLVQQLRARDDLLKPPGVAETLDWARALTYLGTAELDLASAAATLGALLKYREDADRVKAALDRMLAAMTQA